MPTIAIFYGIIVQMYWRDHAPPHIHVLYQGFEGVVDIATGEVSTVHMEMQEKGLLRRTAA